MVGWRLGRLEEGPSGEAGGYEGIGQNGCPCGQTGEERDGWEIIRGALIILPAPRPNDTPCISQEGPGYFTIPPGGLGKADSYLFTDIAHTF